MASEIGTLPKCLAPINGVPFLFHQIQALSNLGVTDFILAAGYGSDQVLSEISNGWASDFRVRISVEEFRLGTGGASLSAAERFDLSEFFVVNGDTFINGDISPMMQPLNRGDSELLRLGLYTENNSSRFGSVEISPSGKVLSFREKEMVLGEANINCGLYRCAIDAFYEFSGSFSLEHEVFPALLEKGSLCATKLRLSEFIDIGVPEDYQRFVGSRV